jgi:hypothetical protein
VILFCGPSLYDDESLSCGLRESNRFEVDDHMAWAFPVRITVFAEMFVVDVRQSLILGGFVLGAVVLATLAGLLLLIWRRRRATSQLPEPDLFIDVTKLNLVAMPETGPRAEIYGTPVQIAVVVVAPAGRQGELPPPDMLPGVLERLVPGLPSVIASHRPRLCQWPQQLSTQGFAQRFFNQVMLPGDRGKGTPWCSLAGKLQLGNRLFLVGLACRAAQPNGLGQIVIQHEGQWLDILRIRDE